MAKRCEAKSVNVAEKREFFCQKESGHLGLHYGISRDGYAHRWSNLSEDLREREGDQPLPTTSPDSQNVEDLILAHIRERTVLGVTRYGKPLQTWNRRNAPRDAREEAVDHLQYAFQREAEWDYVRERIKTLLYLMAAGDASSLSIAREIIDDLYDKVVLEK